MKVLNATYYRMNNQCYTIETTKKLEVCQNSIFETIQI